MKNIWKREKGIVSKRHFMIHCLELEGIESAKEGSHANDKGVGYWPFGIFFIVSWSMRLPPQTWLPLSVDVKDCIKNYIMVWKDISAIKSKRE